MAEKKQAPRSTRQTKAAGNATADESSASLVIDGKEHKFDDLTLGELEELEEHCGGAIGDLNLGSMKVMAFMLYVIRRREDPGFTLEDARATKISSLSQSGDGEGPTSGTSG